ncbi:hypothetical protein N6H18_04355 [Reichenbachiella agarivorans]|uniref:Uncharacterized protein n=1 Tax=Reichenbachiella agarivorans TaxID=2979464 RepID=A0ABY6CRN6_9BACT|nr:hypothetical protein [Reichenbachiella agarivorans]UXP33186.1 hypothetical protein N6H18_04355 [Reichenbachiella agarivorans]
MTQKLIITLGALVAATIIVLLSSGYENDPMRLVSFDQPFSIQEGETVLIKKTRHPITFVKVLEHSLCPTDLNCIWAGRLVIKVAMDNQDFDLLLRGDEKPIVSHINGFNITLNRILYPSVSDEKTDQTHPFKVELIVADSNS